MTEIGNHGMDDTSIASAVHIVASLRPTGISSLGQH